MKIPPFEKARPVVLFFAGIFCLLWLVVIPGTRPSWAYILVAGVLGLPLMQIADKVRLNGNDPKPDDEGKKHDEVH